jgi:hypothetical protein
VPKIGIKIQGVKVSAQWRGLDSALRREIYQPNRQATIVDYTQVSTVDLNMRSIFNLSRPTEYNISSVNNYLKSQDVQNGIKTHSRIYN